MATDLNNLSISELKKIKKDNQKKLKKEYEELKKKQKLIEDIIKIQNTREKINKNQKPKTKPDDPVLEYKRLKRELKLHEVEKINMTFDEYFQKCIQGKRIPADAPPYMRKALERAIREFGQGIGKEKSSLENFATKYAIDGSSDNIIPFDYFKSKSSYLKEFLRNHPNIKVKFILVCLMEKEEWEKDYLMTFNDKAYFNSDTFINIESTDVKEILAKVIHTILEKISIYQQNGSGWYFKEVLHFEIYTVVYKPIRGSSYIPLPDWIMLKKAIVNVRNTDEKCFLWCVLAIDIFTQERRMI